MLKQENYKILDRMIYDYRRYLFSGVVGEYLNHRRGSSNEFHDYREYMPGDDLRNINWKGYIRHGKLFTKQFHEEAFFYVHLLIDNSRSMAVLEDKKYAAIRLANSLAYIALAVRLPVHVELLCKYHPGLRQQTAVPVRNIRQLELHLERYFSPPLRVAKKWWQWGPREKEENPYEKDLEQVSNSVMSYARNYHKKSGLALFISDFLYEPERLNELVRCLLKANFETRAIQITSPEETPEGVQVVDKKGQVRLFDAETGEVLPVEFTPEAYRESYEAHAAQIAAVMKNNQLPILNFLANEPAVLFIRNHMMELGIVR